MRPLTSTPIPVHPLGRVPKGGEGTGRTARGLGYLLGLGLPVPPGFVLTAEAPAAGLEAVVPRVREALEALERSAGGPVRMAVRSDPLSHAPPVPPTFGMTTAEALIAEIRTRWDAASEPTAIIVQRLVAADADDRSGSGVVFTRDPLTGSPGGYGRYAAGRAGDAWREDIGGEPLYSLRNASPDAWDALERALPVIETSLSDMCEVRFTVEAGQLWILQARPGPRHPAAEVRIAVDLVDEGILSVPQAIERVCAPALVRLQAPVLSMDQPLDIVARGRGVAPGVVSGRVVLAGQGGRTSGVLVTDDVVPADHGALGILTSAVDGMRRLAAGPPAVSLHDLRVDQVSARAHVGEGQILAAGDPVTVDGGNGLVVRGEPRLVSAPLDHTLARFLDWCDARAAGRVEIAAAAPEGDVLITVDDDAPADALEGAVQRAVGAGAGGLSLGLPAGPFSVDPHPPLGPWKTVVAGPEATWAARLVAARLAARLDYDPV